MGREKNDVAFFVFSGLISDLAFENEIELTAEMLVLQKSIDRSIGSDPIKYQLALPLACETRHFESVAEIAPRKLGQRVIFQIDL